MDLTGTLPIITSVGTGAWYGAGVNRLERSLIYCGFPGELQLYKNELPHNSAPHDTNPYEFKIRAFEKAFEKSNIVLWLDASFWAIKNPMPIMDIIVDQGVFAFRSGYNCAQTCTDALLYDVGMTRDEAQNLPETATGAVGLNISNPKGKEVFEYWKGFCDRGLFKNSRSHDLNDSPDPRFLFGRQDQSAFSMALYKANVSFLYEDYVAYWNDGNPGYDKSKCFFFIGGL